jgi:hypothetical protein
MQSSYPTPTLRENEISEIISYVRIAELHGSHLTLAEALRLTSSELSESELADAWTRMGDLSYEFPLHSGRFVSRRSMQESGISAIETKLADGRRRAAANLRMANAVWKVFSGDGLRMFAVSGGNSYGFARRTDDIDVFCVSRTDSMWLFVLKQLLVSRFYSTFRKDIPRLCFSYVLDERTARRAFSEPKDRLFARDALNLKVIEGQDFFISLIRGAGWMGRLFPNAYATSVNLPAEPVREDRPSAMRRILNLFLLRSVGFYIRFKSALDNARNRKQRNVRFVNDLSTGEGHLLFESRKYQNLRGMYATDGGRNPPARPR